MTKKLPPISRRAARNCSSAKGNFTLGAATSRSFTEARAFGWSIASTDDGWPCRHAVALH
jgi:hypothetical protein